MDEFGQGATKPKPRERIPTSFVLLNHTPQKADHNNLLASGSILSHMRPNSGLDNISLFVQASKCFVAYIIEPCGCVGWFANNPRV